jgi:hypothetical protein
MQGLGSVGHALEALPLVVPDTVPIAFGGREVVETHRVGVPARGGAPVGVAQLDGRGVAAGEQQERAQQGESESSHGVLPVGAKSRPEAG